MLYLYFIQNRDRPDTTTFTSGHGISQQNKDGQTNFYKWSGNITAKQGWTK